MKKLSSGASGRTSAIQECAPDGIRGADTSPAPHPLCKENSRFKIQDLKERPIIFSGEMGYGGKI